MEFADQWLWLIFVGIGLVMVMLEFLGGGFTGFELVIIGSVFVIGGLVASPFDSWPVAVIITSVLCFAYIIVGRRYLHRWTQTRKAKTNIDAIIGTQGVVVKEITKYAPGRIQIRGVRWRAVADEDMEKGQEVTVIEISGTTLTVKRTSGGD
jgi:membrane protein implicated in regulation of membrane protease activity